ncbi:MAG: ankyrin repeat domain-containing protein [Parachlamydiaceae bacterium]|nr:MAG: ankyrin repeat domain-containing protein [Parachlamydiaceae bacterium]
MKAIQYGHKEMAFYLIQYGFDFDRSNTQGETVRSMAQQKGGRIFFKNRRKMIVRLDSSI